MADELRSHIRISRRHALYGGMCVVAGTVATLRTPQVLMPAIAEAKFSTWVPDRTANWTAAGIGDLVLPPPDELSDRLYDNLITRVYRRPSGAEVMLLLAYNNRQDGMLQVHRPEVCYPVGGFELTETQSVETAVGSARIPSSRFTASSRGRIEHVFYFTRVGAAFPRTWAQQRSSVMAANLRGIIPDGMLMRVSALSPDMADVAPAISEFFNEFYAAAAPQLRQLLIGENLEFF